MNSNLIGNRIKALMIIAQMKRSYLAKKMGISYNTLTKKINGRREFTINEMLKIKEIFDLDINSFSKIFFDEDYFMLDEGKNKLLK